MKKSKNIFLYQSSVIGWIVIIVEPVDASIRTILSEIRMVQENSTRRALSIGSTMDMFVAISLVQRTM